MDTLYQEALKGLIQSGPLAVVLGLIVLALGGAVVYLYKQNMAHRDELMGLFREAAKGDRDGDGKPG